MSQVLELLSLQGIDDESASFRAALADVEHRLEGDDELTEARRSFATTEAALVAIRKDQRRIEAEVEDFSDKIAREEKRLYDGSVKNPKELANLQHEVDLIKGQRGKSEDQLIEVLDGAEAANQAHRDASRLVTSLEARWQGQQDALRHEAHRLRDLITRADVRREAQKSKVPPRALPMYEDLRRRKGGMAVARIVGPNCSGCRITIPDGIRKRAFGDIVQCPNCERILALG